MIANFLDYFYSEVYDNNVIIKNKNGNYKVSDIKKLVLEKINQTRNVDFQSLDSFDFIIEFLANIFVSNDIFLNEIKTIKAIPIKTFPKTDTNKIIIHFKTSGSTGDKKEILKSLSNVIKEGKDIYNNFQEICNLEFITTATMHHLFGFTFHFMTPFNNGEIINTETVLSEDDINIESSCLVTTPSFVEKMSKYKVYPKILPKAIITAGAKLKDDDFKFAKTITDNVIEIYGSTETGVIAYRKTYKEDFTPFCGTKIKITTEGALVETPYSIQVPILIKDKIEIVNSKIKIEGRLDRIFKIQEKRISGDEIENYINKHEFIKDSYALKHKNKLKIAIVLNDIGLDFIYKNDILKLKKELREYLYSKFNMTVKAFKFIDDIPTTKSGKKDLKEIEKLFNLNLSVPIVFKKEIKENKLLLKLYFYKNCNFYKGHFENFPITPGVVQLFMAKYFLKTVFKIEPFFKKYKKIKFTNIIKPDTFIDLEIEKTENYIIYKYKDEDKIYSTGVLSAE